VSLSTHEVRSQRTPGWPPAGPRRYLAIRRPWAGPGLTLRHETPALGQHPARAFATALAGLGC